MCQSKRFLGLDRKGKQAFTKQVINTPTLTLPHLGGGNFGALPYPLSPANGGEGGGEGEG